MLKKLIKTCLPMFMMYISKDQHEPLLSSSSSSSIHTDYSADFPRRLNTRRLVKLS